MTAMQIFYDPEQQMIPFMYWRFEKLATDGAFL
jgi:hypothetical protein